MNEWTYFFQPSSESVETGTYRIFQPDIGTEVHAWIASDAVEPSQKDALIAALINFEDRCGDFFHYRAYLLAAELIAEFPESVFADRIIDQLLQWSYAYYRVEKSDWKIYPKALSRSAWETLTRSDRSRIVDRLTTLVHQTKDLWVFRHAAVQLGQIDRGNPDAIAALIHLIHYPQPPRQKFRAIVDLHTIAPDHPIVIPNLIELIEFVMEEPDLYLGIIRNEMWIFQDMAISTQDISTVIEFFADLMQRWKLDLASYSEETATTELNTRVEQWIFLQRTIAHTLGKIGLNNDRAITLLLDMLQHTWLKANLGLTSAWEIISALRTIAIAHPQAIQLLSEQLSQVPDRAWQGHLAVALLKIDPGNQLAIAVLLEILATTSLEKARWKIEGITGHEYGSYEGTIWLLWLSADALGRDNSTCVPAMNALFELAATWISDRPYLPVFESLMAIDPTGEWAIAAFTALLETKPNDFLGDAIGSFHDIRFRNPVVINALTQLLQRSQYDFNRESAAWCLGILDPDNGLAIQTLIDLLNCESDRSKWWTAQKLGKIGMQNECAVMALIQFVQTSSEWSDERDRQEFVGCFQSITSSSLLTKVVLHIKPSFTLKTVSISPVDSLMAQPEQRWHDIVGNSLEVQHQILWHCAQIMRYEDFYDAWWNDALMEGTSYLHPHT